ncbi:MAG: WXG100 family type VII secretion target [Blautia sp.]|nr:WXG100 family type VII secretion target [Blautia sp.]
MASEIRVTSSMLRTKKEELEQMNSNFQEIASALETAVRALDGSWEGETHDAFYNAFQMDKGKMDVFSTAVKSYTEALASIIARYEATEQSNAAIAARR